MIISFSAFLQPLQKDAVSQSLRDDEYTCTYFWCVTWRNSSINDINNCNYKFNKVCLHYTMPTSNFHHSPDMWVEMALLIASESASRQEYVYH